MEMDAGLKGEIIMKKFILASTSPRRKEILTKFKVPFKIIKPRENEDELKRALKGAMPEKVACVIAFEKAKSVAAGLKKGIVIGADTIVVLGKKRIIGKPRDENDAIKILTDLSRNTHRVITAVAVIDALTGKTVVFYDTSYVTFKHMSPEFIKKYIKENHVMDKAGAYGAQENSDPFIKSIKGSYYNVVGLPIERLKAVLKNWDRI